MMSGGNHHGRRDNGLDASEYAVAGDVDPRVGEHLLDVLGLAGIAAYLQPTADLHPVIRTTTLPSRPIDRLYVDRQYLTEARGYLDKLGPAAAPSHPASTDPDEPHPRPTNDPLRPESPRSDPARPGSASVDPTAEPSGGPGTAAEADETTGPELEAAWASIVADFDAPVDSPVPPWPVEEDLPDDERGESADTDRPGPDEPSPAGETGFELPRWRGDSRPGDLLNALDAEADDEGYEPPPPPPLPRPSRYTALAVAAIVLGLLLCVRPDLLGILGFGTAGGMTVGFCCLLAGFIILVARLRPGDDGDSDDGDDGAVV